MGEIGGDGAGYRGIAPVQAWGALRAPPARDHPSLPEAVELATTRGAKHGVGKFGHGTGTGGAQSSDGGGRKGRLSSVVTGSTVLTRRRPASGSHRRARGARDSADTDGPPTRRRPEEGRGGRTRQVQPESSVRAECDAAATPDRTRRGARPGPGAKAGGEGTEYPEWDWESGDYRPHGAPSFAGTSRISPDGRWGAGCWRGTVRSLGGSAGALRGLRAPRAAQPAA